jgi:hypothetical protein
MNIIRSILFLLTVFNCNFSLKDINTLLPVTSIAGEEQVSILTANGIEYILEYDEDLKLFENSAKNLIQDGCYKLYYIDESINTQIIFYNDYPITFSIKISEFKTEDIEIINKLVNLLGHKSSEYYTFINERRYYYKHIYSNEIVFMIFDSWIETNFEYIWIFKENHPLNYIRPPE